MKTESNSARAVPARRGGRRGTSREQVFAVTKLAPPRHDRALVRRCALLAQLAANRFRTLILVHAAAGSGKSTLLAQWRRELIAAGACVAWYALDAADTAEAHFLHGVLQSLRHAGAAIGAGPYDLYQRHRRDRAKSFVDALVNECSALGEEIYLVLDDFHQVDDTAHEAVLARLVERAPPNLHLIVASRTRLALPLALWKAQDRAYEIRTSDLLFDGAETRTFLDNRLPGRVSAGGASRLHEATEGWAAALQLAVIALHDDPDLASFLATYAGETGDVSAFLTRDVLARLPAALTAFMTRTSILSTFNAALCAELVGNTDTAALLRDIERRNLFIVRLEREGWYRYHPLFRELLERELAVRAPGEVAHLHLAASAWFERHGQAADAVHHALAGGSPDRALDLIEDCAPALVQEGRWTTLLGWFEALDPPDPARRPALFCAAATAQVLSGRLDEAHRTIDRLAAVAPRLSPLMRARMAVVRGVCAVWQDDSARAEREVRDLMPLPAGESMYGGGACNVRAWACIHAGDFDRARVSLAHAARFQRAPAIHAAHVYTECFRGMCYVMQGRLAHGAAVFAAILEAAERQAGRRSALACIPASFLAEVVYEHEGADAVDALLGDRLAVIRETVLPDGILRAFVAAARAHARGGDTDRALECLYLLQSTGEAGGNDRLVAASFAERVRLLLVEGDLPAARAVQVHLDRLCAGYAAAPTTTHGQIALAGSLSGARLALADGSPEIAAHTLAELAARLESATLTWPLARVCVVRGAALHLVGERATALVEARRALDLMHALGLRRTLADELAVAGAAAKPIVHAWQNVEGARAEDFEFAIGNAPGYGEAQVLSPAALAGATFSAREHEVLELLSRGVPNKRIATLLDISTDTVKFHLKNVYQKLGVGNRTHAVERARALHLTR